jgi:multidrug efflux pump subunit AcrB
MTLGLSGILTRASIGSPLTPLFLLAAFALGLLALIGLPREEEPQISVPMVDLFVRADGLKAEDAVKLITEPLETIIKAINGVEHVYSSSNDDRVLVTARFLVGTSCQRATWRLAANASPLNASSSMSAADPLCRICRAWIASRI